MIIGLKRVAPATLFFCYFCSMKRTSIIFVCHGNICRSPMAEFIFKDKIRSRGLNEQFYVESAAVSTEEIGNSIYPPAKRCLNAHGIPFDTSKTARQITRADYDRFDQIGRASCRERV